MKACPWCGRKGFRDDQYRVCCKKKELVSLVETIHIKNTIEVDVT